MAKGFGWDSLKLNADSTQTIKSDQNIKNILRKYIGIWEIMVLIREASQKAHH